MNEQIKFKEFLPAFIISTVILVFIFIKTVLKQQTRLVFCDVGQGDAIYLRLRTGEDILIDAGPNQQVLTCLGKYLPFYDKTIEYAFLTHPEKDHYSGYLKIIEHYHIQHFYLTATNQNDADFTQLLHLLKAKGITPQYLYANDYLTLNQTTKFTVLWPDKSFAQKSSLVQKKTDLNNLSLVMGLQDNNFNLLLTGDIPTVILERLLQKSPLRYDVLKIPHHGSKYGLNQKILQLAEPTLAVISVGKNNLHNHPAPEVINLLQALKIKIRRTDLEGDIVF